MYKVIIVDDEMIVRHAVQTLIRWEEGGFEFAGSASSGRSALELARKTNADIVITDIKMPEMDGLELIKRLMEEGFKGEIIVLSNYNDFEIVREALKCGAHDYMLKLTLKTEAFMRTLGEVASKLEGKRGTASLATAADAEKPAARLIAILREMDDAYAGNAKSAFREDGLPEREGLAYLPFLVLLQDNEPWPHRVGGFPDMLEKLADGLFASGSASPHIVHTRHNRSLLVLSASEPELYARSKELAERLVSLAEMYYDVQICVVYAPAAIGPGKVAEEIRNNRLTEGLLFYSRYRAACLPNRLAAQEEGAAFERAEADLERPERRSWSEWSSLTLQLVEAGSSCRVQPDVLKRAIARSIWLMAHRKERRLTASEEKAWLGKIESADSDTQLMDRIRELAEEATGTEGGHAASPAAREEVRQAIAYMRSRYMERIAITDIASHVGLSEAYLCHVFKAETGSSMLNCLNDIRMSKAYELLETGNYLVKQASYEVGISDPFYFNRLFKKRFGIAPKHVKRHN
ncbi:response regulator transcription factor [Paenibacillus methanolicus]|uniref:Helix-turn-helix protein n=1 Tax=Paenibacillus methanolicus TaxID=582686 RepID=A0A5S5CJ57_9BACL|nr:response regulator [Paenibacillus methanolicus]TYP78947.1 helix-turn-helix protein [Paenibacillus methanolicus]